MGSVEKKEIESRNDRDVELGHERFIDMIRETNDEILQVEELRTHTERLKQDLVNYFTGVMEKYELELTIPAESFSFKDKEADNLQAAFLNDSGIISYHFKDGFVKSYLLRDYHPSELMTLFSVVVPNLNEALRVKRKEYEDMSNTLSKIKRYMTLLKEKVKEGHGPENPSLDEI